MTDYTIGCGWEAGDAVGYVPAPSGLWVSVRRPRGGGRATWALRRGRGTIARGAWSPGSLATRDVAIDGAERALCAAWRRGLS